MRGSALSDCVSRCFLLGCLFKSPFHLTPLTPCHSAQQQLALLTTLETGSPLPSPFPNSSPLYFVRADAIPSRPRPHYSPCLTVAMAIRNHLVRQFCELPTQPAHRRAASAAGIPTMTTLTQAQGQALPAFHDQTIANPTNLYHIDQHEMTTTCLCDA